MQYIIYAAEVAGPEATAEQSEAFAKVYAEALEAAFQEAGHDVEVEVHRNVTGAGSGLKGCEDHRQEMDINDLAGQIWERELEKFFAVEA